MGDGADIDLIRLPDGRRAQLWEGGAPAGPTVFFLHGCPDTRHAARTGDAAARRTGVHLVAVNRPGYGRSDPHESGHVSVADDVVAVADLLGIDRFAVLGMSVGGAYALACAARHPDRVTAAGVVAAPAVVPELDPPCHRDDLSATQQSFFAQLAASTVDEADDLVRPEYEAFVAKVSPDDPDDRALVARWLGGIPEEDALLLEGLPPADIAAAAREELANLDGYLRDAAVTFRAWEVRPELVRCPTWLWYGDLDANASVRNGWWLAERIEGATLVIRSKTTHLATLIRHWDEILTTLRDAE
jgi:pimeloyl-ACP methyl ester carboxylesterase